MVKWPDNYAPSATRAQGGYEEYVAGGIPGCEAGWFAGVVAGNPGVLLTLWKPWPDGWIRLINVGLRCANPACETASRSRSGRPTGCPLMKAGLVNRAMRLARSPRSQARRSSRTAGRLFEHQFAIFHLECTALPLHVDMVVDQAEAHVRARKYLLLGYDLRARG